MHIKQIIIQGFKSYRDQLQVEPFSEHHNVVGMCKPAQRYVDVHSCSRSQRFGEVEFFQRYDGGLKTISPILLCS